MMMTRKIITNILLLSALLLISASFASASTPDYSVNHLLEEQVSNGDNDFGDILFVEQPYIAEQHTLSTIKDYNLQRFDKIRWEGSKALRILTPNGDDSVLVQGSEYYFSKTGTYQIFDMNNDSNTAFINSEPEDPNRISISPVSVPQGMDLSFSKDNFTLDDQQTVKATLEVDDDVESKDYTIEYSINGDGHSQEVSVQENYNWTLNYTGINKSPEIRAGEDLYMGRVVINNTGNMQVDIKPSKEGENLHMLVVPGEKTLYRKSKIYFDLQAQIPSVAKVGTYDYNIVFKGAELEKNFTVSIDVIDSIKPEIETINFSSDKAFVNNDITVTATDNNNVSNVTLYYDDRNVSFDKDGNIFTTNTTFDKLSMYEMTFCAFDSSDNEHCVDINKTFSKTDVIDGYRKVLDMPSVKYGDYSETKLFNLTDDVPSGVEVLIRSVDSVGGEDVNISDAVTFRVTKDDGSIKKFGSTTRKVVLKERGVYYFEVRSNKKTDLEGILSLSMAEKYDEVDDITFKSGFKDYDVPEDFTKGWINDQTLRCTVNDTGDLDTSSRICSFELPVDVRKEDISVPMTVAQKDKIESQISEMEAESEDLKNRLLTIIVIGAGITLILALWLYYRINLYPLMRHKGGKTKDYTKY